jgi:hypothetical protein
MTTEWARAHAGAVRWSAALLPLTVAWLLGLGRVEVATSVAAIVLVIPVVAAAATGDRWAGVLAALAGAAGFDYFLTAPYLSFSINRREDVELAAALLVVGLAVTELSLWGHRQSASAARRQEYLDELVELLGVPADPSGQALPAAIEVTLASVLRIDRAHWVDGSPGVDEAVVDSEGVVRLHGRPLPVRLEGLPTDGSISIPVSRSGQVIGRFQLVAASRAARPTRDELRAAVLLANSMVRQAPQTRAP